MSPDRTHRLVRAGVVISALCFAALGAMLLFAPDEVSGLLLPGGGGGILVQLFGAALLGFGAMTWIARGSLLGGIYGRAVVAGNQTHLTIGALLLVKRCIDAGAEHPALKVLASLYVVGAVFFGYLTFFSPGVDKK